MALLINRSRLLFGDLLQVGRSITRTLSTPTDYVDIIEYSNGARKITLNHPKTKNSLSIQMMKDLHKAITSYSTDQTLRSIMITNTGDVFSAGHNLKELRTDKGEAGHKEVFETCMQLMKAIEEAPVPVIAVVDGLAAAGGCQLVAACDIAVATEQSYFATSGINVGVFCSTPSVPVLRSMSRKMAAHMLFTGDEINAQQAYEAGLISRVLSQENLQLELEIMTDLIASKSRSVIQMGKEFLRKQRDLNTEDAYKLAVETMVKNLKLKDAQEGIIAFFEKREPNYQDTMEEVKVSKE
ncbi:hypothetical protein TKK_0012122 [Trichogramma kaykai]|uniref:Enoyl-CoA hydratase domain-containing protein 3, mitochondrial n=1 Tax=Trichogramma kaykai TaxID=54128 RepID=A0ABD2WNG9_9HYME